jgi:hypothetical protein
LPAGLGAAAVAVVDEHAAIAVAARARAEQETVEPVVGAQLARELRRVLGLALEGVEHRETVAAAE